jgi:quercetin dioxygenase-like cupin family protein
MSIRIVDTDVAVSDAAGEARDSGLWDWLNVRKLFTGSRHTGVHDLVLRFHHLQVGTVGEVFDDVFNTASYFPWHVMPHCAQLARLMSIHSQDIGRVMLTRLDAGAKVGLHCDEGKYARAHTRYHVVLQGEGAFSCGEKAILTRPGMVFTFDTALAHAAVAHTERTHLIVDVRN